ncbi:MAG: hypothetical protein AAGF04_04775 [Chlamydiota bacterium]
MGCQREIAEKILEKSTLFEKQSKSLAPRYPIPVSGSERQQLERFYRCKVWATEDLGDILQQHQWPGLRSAVLIESIREVQGNRSAEKRLYSSSLTPDAERIAGGIPAH